MEARILRKGHRRRTRSVNFDAVVTAEASIAGESPIPGSEVEDTSYSFSIFVSDVPHQPDNTVWCLDL
jgi:hypothetical protein